MVDEFLAGLRGRGIEVERDGDDLLVRPMDQLTDEDLSSLRALKPELLAHLQTNARKPVFTEREVETLILAICAHEASEEEVEEWLKWAHKARISGAVLEGVLKGTIELADFREGQPVIRRPNGPPRTPSALRSRASQPSA